MNCGHCGGPAERYQGWTDREAQWICADEVNCRKPISAQTEMPRIEDRFRGNIEIVSGETACLDACKARPQVCHHNNLRPAGRPWYWVIDADERLWGFQSSAKWEEFLG